MGDVWKANEMLHDCGGIVSGGEDIKVADGLASAPKATGNLKFSDRAAISHMGAELRRDSRRVRIEHSTALASAMPLQRFPDSLLELRSKAGEFPEPPRFDSVFQIVAAANVQAVNQKLQSLGTQTGNVSEFEQPGRKFCSQFVVQRQIAGLDDGPYLFRQIGPDPGNFVDLLRGQVGDLHGLIANRLRGVTVGPDAKEILARQLQHVGGLA